MFHILESMPIDLAELITFLNEDDRIEGEAISGSTDLLTPLLAEYHRGDSWWYSVYRASDQKLVAVGGYDETGRVWFMMTDVELTFTERRGFLKVLKAFKWKALQKARVLWNEVLWSNKQHVKLLTYLGADFGEARVVNGHLFKSFNIGGDLWDW